MGILAAVVLAAGCGTIGTQTTAHREEAVSCSGLCGATPNMYSGTVVSFKVLYPLFVPLLALDVPLERPEVNATQPRNCQGPLAG